MISRLVEDSFLFSFNCQHNKSLEKYVFKGSSRDTLTDLKINFYSVVNFKSKILIRRIEMFALRICD